MCDTEESDNEKYGCCFTKYSDAESTQCGNWMQWQGKGKEWIMKNHEGCVGAWGWKLLVCGRCRIQFFNLFFHQLKKKLIFLCTQINIFSRTSWNLYCTCGAFYGPHSPEFPTLFILQLQIHRVTCLVSMPTMFSTEILHTSLALQKCGMCILLIFTILTILYLTLLWQWIWRYNLVGCDM